MITRYRLVAAAVPLTVAMIPSSADAPAQWWVYIGTYTRGPSEGIYLLRMDAETGRLDAPILAGAAENPSFLALHPTRPLLYSVGQMAAAAGTPGGAANAFAIDPGAGTLSLINQAPSIGAGPCHIAVDRAGRHAIIANYSGGSVAVFPIKDDGGLGEASAFIQHAGSSVHPQRQERPHAHSVTLDADNRFVFAADLGADKMFIYRYDGARGTLEPNDPPWADLAPGAGPRHFAFHPTGKFAYAINELDCTITAFSYDSARGRLDTLQTVPTLPDDFDGENTTAEIRVHPSGRFLYGSNRGHDSIAAFAVDSVTGRLTPLGHSPTRGRTPRNFNIDPAGRFLLAANQDTDNVVVFRIEPETGMLEPTGHEAAVPMPVCVVFTAPLTASE